MLNRLYEELDVITTRGSIESKEIGFDFQQYKKTALAKWDEIYAEEQRIRDKKGTIRLNQLRPRQIYKIEDIQNDVIRKGLINNGTYIRIAPNRNGEEYTAYDFKVLNHEEVMFLTRVYCS